ncbi:MAG TPA: ferredoxin [Mycobacteriales bacterium]|nr:ferredoxin [Mycobacteriales bacterium]
MAGERLQVYVDQDLCTGDGLCVQLAPQVFEFDVDGLAYVKDGTGELRTEAGARVAVPAGCAAEVLESAQGCPGDCIFVETADGAPVAGPLATPPLAG